MMGIFTVDNIILNAVFDDKIAAVKAAGQILVDNGYVEAAYIEDMLEREKAVSTYIGNAVAIPHGIITSKERIKRSGISFIQVPQGVAFGEETAHLVIGIAGKDNEHLEILGQIANVCLEMENVDKLVHAKTKEEILDLFKEVV